jgi:hypothetical protein
MSISACVITAGIDIIRLKFFMLFMMWPLVSKILRELSLFQSHTWNQLKYEDTESDDLVVGRACSGQALTRLITSCVLTYNPQCDRMSSKKVGESGADSDFK